MNLPTRSWGLIVTALASALAVAGCAQAPLPQGPQAQYDLPTPLATTQINLPIDAVRVAAAIVDRLYGGTGAAAGVSFGGRAARALDQSGAGLPGFDWRNTVLLQYTAPENAPNDRIAAGELRFDDALGRQAVILFTVEYSTVEPIEVQRVTVSSLFALDPVPVLYVVRADALNDLGSEVLESHGDLLAAVAEVAIPWQELPANPGGDGEYLAVVFLMNRVSPSAEFSVGVSSTRDGPAYGGAVRYLEDHEWRAAVLPGRFVLGETAPFVQASFRPGSEVGAVTGRPKTIGVFALDPTLARAARAGG